MDTETGNTQHPEQTNTTPQSEKEHAMNQDTKTPEGEVVAPNESANEKAAGKEAKAVKPVARYSFEKYLADLTRRNKAIFGTTDAILIGDANAAATAISQGTPIAAAVFKAMADRDAAKAKLATASGDMGGALGSVAAPIRRNKSGRAFYSSCMSKQSWVTFRNLDAGLAEAGFTVMPALLEDGRAKATLAEEAYQEFLAAVEAVTQARARYETARIRVSQAMSRFRMAMKRADIGKAGVRPVPQPAPAPVPPPVTPVGSSGGTAVDP
jgi:hypothetical protein